MSQNFSEKKVKISAFIIAKNEEARIAKAINSLKPIADEIIVVDSGSTDNTVSLSASLGAKIVFNQWQGYVLQKAFGEKLCSHDWILNIDADEELTPELQQEIKKLVNSGAIEDNKAYRLKLVILHRNDTKAKFLAPSNQFIRLYDRNFCSFANTKNTTTHDTATFNEDIKDTIFAKVANLSALAYHRSGTSIEQLISKANFYSSEQAKDMMNLKREPSNIRIAFEMPLCFLKVFFIRRYFVFGFDGFVDSILFAFARFLRLAKARELKIAEQLKEIGKHDPSED